MRKLEAVNGSGSRHLPRTWLLHTKVFQRTVFARRLSCADLGNVKQCFYKFSRHFAISFLFLSIYIIQNFLIKGKKCGYQFLPVLVNYGSAHFLPGRQPHHMMGSSATMNLLPIEKRGTTASMGTCTSSPSGAQSSFITLYSAPFFDFSYSPFAIGLCLAKQ